MSRSGYNEDIDQQDHAMWRGRVASAIRGKRGQKLLADMISALDAMPVKELQANVIVRDGQCCAIGAVAIRRGVAIPDDLNPESDEHESHSQADYNELLGDLLDISPCLAAEVQYMNDEVGPTNETPAERWTRMRAWAVRNLKAQGGAS